LKASLAFLKVILNNVSPSDLSVAGRSEGLSFFYKKRSNHIIVEIN